MYKNTVVGVVVPAYNEEGFVGDVLETLPAFVDRAYVIDDCSTDDTWTEICATAERINAATAEASEAGGALGGEAEPERAAAGAATVELADEGGPAPAPHEQRSDGGTVNSEYGDASNGSTGETVVFQDRIVPIQHEENRGVGGAIKTGYQHALRDEIDVVAVMGGDGQMDPAHLTSYLDPIIDGDVDYTKGNRLLSPEFRAGMPPLRQFGNWILTFLTKIASGYWRTMDPQNGYSAISKDALEAVEIDRMYEDYGYCNDLLVRLNVAEMRVGDVPLAARYGDETSSIRYHTYIPKVSTMLLRDFLWRLKEKYLIRRFHPLSLLYGVGAAATLYGLFAMARSAVSRVRESDTGRQSNGLTLFVIGWVSMILAMIFDLEENADNERRFE